MKRWFKRIVVAGAVLLGLSLLFLIEEHFRGRRSLGRHIAASEDRGEVLAVSDLAPKRPPDSENAAVALFALSNAVARISTNEALYPPAMRFAAPGKAVAIATMEKWTTEEGGTVDWGRLEQVLASEVSTLENLTLAAARPSFEGGFDYHSGFVDFEIGWLASMKDAIQVLSAVTLADLHRGDRKSALSHLVATVNLPMRQRPEPLIITQLVRQACLMIAANTTWQALQSPGWTDDDLARLQLAWSHCDLPGDMGRALEMERAMNLDFFRQIKASYGTLEKVVREREQPEWAMAGDTLPTSGFFLHWVHVPVYRVAWVDQDALHDLKKWDFLIGKYRRLSETSWADFLAEAQDPVDPLSWAIEFGDPEEGGWYDRLRYLFSNSPISITDGLLRRCVSTQTHQQMVVTAIAISRYRLAHGVEPFDLEALVPDYLAEPPQDLMDGGLLRYRMRPEGGLYSVGVDGRDDGGDPAPIEPGAHYGNIWQGRDALWPVVAEYEESLTALEPRQE